MSKLEATKTGGKINRAVMQRLLKATKPGVTLSELDRLSGKLIRKHKATPSFKDYNGFSGNICANINSGLIHGIPDNYQLREGDVLTIDQGVFYEGYHTDCTESVEVLSPKSQISSTKSEKNTFLKIGRQALEKAIVAAVAGGRVGDISYAMQRVLVKAGYYVVREYVGHGVGQELHEEPQIPCYGKANTGPKLKEGQTLAIEVMYTDVPSRLEVGRDGWTVVAKSATLATLFEKTIMVRRGNPLILT